MPSVLHRLVVSALALSALACGVSDQNGLPKDVEDPTLVLTPRGAIGRYQGTVALVPQAFDATVFWANAVPSDEVAMAPGPIGAQTSFTAIDSRQDWALDLGDNTEKNPSFALNRLRVQAHEARGLLATYVHDSLPALRGHLYALEGYTELLLADAYCSGIPLSTVDVGGDYTLTPGFPTDSIYQHAIALFDSATALATDGSSLAVDTLQSFAALGRGRALLALGDYDGAATAVAAVPDDYLYQVTVSNPKNDKPSWIESEMNHDLADPTTSPHLTVGDRQGINGLDFVSSRDPRVPTQALGQDLFGNTIYYPATYPTTGPLTHTMAGGTEARLIEAEAALHNGDVDGWLAKLNALRTDGTFETPDPNGQPGNTDTLWHAGSGRVAGQPVAGLAPLQDPGSDTARVSLLFRERAFWLYLMAHRLGDLRRLVRQYHRNPEMVYPTGSFAGGPGIYGHEVVIAVPASEQTNNPRYTGCIDRHQP